MRLLLATDHAGFELKNQVKEFLLAAGYEVEDMGAHTYDALDDYPDFIAPAAQAVSQQPQALRAIIFGGSGQGEAMVANRFKNVRATVYYGGNLDIITLSRQHNDANVLSLGARFIDTGEATAAIERWLSVVPLGDEKYSRRVKKAERFGGA